MSDSGPVALVTGGSRGAGAGIAHALGSHGCTVYVTGRTENSGEAALAGTIHETAQRVTEAGGTVTQLRGEPIVYNGPNQAQTGGLLATNGRLHAIAVERLRSL
jgi:NAD(P)-dependent dehydrogenase (short-subunit alcohol dehydrogenase family)